ncbi:hypothetical protein KK062_27455 [Fulvivirgaceae bacterium PWU5]|uniref:Uncharacterized protein n=1 Tax=Dawidia cretensis TaxID=2782350 RepID=A0AAP2E2S3_9BACT|nr:hypothetical protein [Dawidia cretensis]MBT1712010.1 hypothetical protein [Dawidia cretensis]
MKYTITAACWPLLPLILVVTACQQPAPVTIGKSDSLTIIDSTTLPEDAEYHRFHEWRTTAYYPIYYIGQVTDSLFLGREPIPRSTYSEHDTGSVLDRADIKIAVIDSTNVKIVVDTLLALPHAYRYYDKYAKEVSDSTQYYESFAVLIYNYAKAPLYVASFSELRHTVRQTKDSLGNWVDIENQISYWCGTGSQAKFIQPGQMLVAKALRKKGNLKVECRLRFHYYGNDVYSNIYLDYIDNAKIREWQQIRESAKKYDLPMPPPIQRPER